MYLNCNQIKKMKLFFVLFCYLKHYLCSVWYENSKESGEAIHSETGSSEYPTGSPELATGSPQHTTGNSTIGPRSKKPST